MKKHVLLFCLGSLTLSGFAPTTWAQGYDRRNEIPAIVNEGRDFREGRPFRDDWARSARTELGRLNAEVSQVRREIGGSRDKRIRERFHRIVQATDRLTAAWEQRRIRGRDVRPRADEIRAQLRDLRRALHDRHEHHRER